MKHKILALLAILCLSLTAHADLASRRAKAQEMLLLLHMDRLMDQLMSGTMDQMSTMTKSLGNGTLKPEDQAKLDDFQKRVYQLISSQVGWKALEPDYVDLYATNFTDEQLDTILGSIQQKPIYQRAVAAQENFDKIMLRVNNSIMDGIKKGAASPIITLG